MLTRSSLIFALVAFSLPVAALPPGNARGTSPPSDIRSDADPPPILAPSDYDTEIVAPPAPSKLTIDPSELGATIPFTFANNYMSLPGAFRYLTYDRTGVWMSRNEAVAQVKDEIESATR